MNTEEDTFTPEEEKYWRPYLNTSDFNVKFVIATHKDTPIKVLREMVKDNDYTVVWGISLNENCPSDLLKYIMLKLFQRILEVRMRIIQPLHLVSLAHINSIATHSNATEEVVIQHQALSSLLPILECNFKTGTLKEPVLTL